MGKNPPSTSKGRMEKAFRKGKSFCYTGKTRAFPHAFQETSMY
ncbi:hypothetical protein LEP1GSC137_0611 [Leptospira borgpetersenii str. Noumea 25]|nr:hypothetical protein LEP1GSC137_0611 [Leptospira borgpetersenii str. Noumea 25]